MGYAFFLGRLVRSITGSVQSSTIDPPKRYASSILYGLSKRVPSKRGRLSPSKRSFRRVAQAFSIALLHSIKSGSRPAFQEIRSKRWRMWCQCK
jgi:hypothetical protein